MPSPLLCAVGLCSPCCKVVYESNRSSIIYFTRKSYKSNREPFIIKGQTVEPKNQVKILSVVMDTGLKYKEHIARAASKGKEHISRAASKGVEAPMD